MSQAVSPDRKQALRQRMRGQRREHFAALPDAVRALVFSRPPATALALVPQDATIGLYQAKGSEAPTLGYARWFHENGHRLALPWFADPASPMSFRAWHDPYDLDELEPGPFGLAQPSQASIPVLPDVVIVPLLGFTPRGDRLGQGGGHYDRWLEANPSVPAIGLGWDCQKMESLPVEPHDRRLTMIVTPTRVHQENE